MIQRVLHDAELTGAESGLGAIADVELGQDVGDVVLDGAFGEVEARPPDSIKAVERRPPRGQSRSLQE